MGSRPLAEQLASYVASDPRAAADLLADQQGAAVLDLVQHLERRLSSAPLHRLERVWQLSASQAAELFGVTRQAYNRWRRERVPAERQADVRRLDAATTMLLNHVKVDRIPAVVRRPAARLGGKSLLDLAREGDLERVRDEVESIFDVRRVQP